jgi:hypothetical protein
MRRRIVGLAGVLAVGASAMLAVPPAQGARTTAGVRGNVVDDNGAPVPDVKIEMEFLGESRPKITRSQTSDKARSGAG